MQRKKLVVIIHGSKTPEPSLVLFKPLFARFYAYFGIEAGPDLWLEPLRSVFATTGAEVMVFSWSGGTSWFAVHRAARDLQQLLRTRSEDDIVLFGQSLGGSIAERVAQDVFLPVRRVIAVVTPHSRFMKKLPSHVEHINLYSPSDNYLRFASNILYVGAGATSVPWARNISLPGLRHSDFIYNREIEVNGTKRRLFDFYKDLVA
ncbi:MAG: hypothetical protein Q7S50_01620 [bacterium]|nr:hypothetical protein [bacterium]